MKIIYDASNTGWFGILSLPGASKQTTDYWSSDDLKVSGGIAVKEANDLYQTLSIFRNELANGRVDAYVDNSNLIDFWNNEVGRNIILTNEIKDFFLLSMELNIALNMHYVPSKLNMADPPSRFYSDLDCAFSTPAWNLVDKAFGPHSFDLMALLSNVKKSRNGCNLKFYSPSHFNEFCTKPITLGNYYVFPPFILLGALLKWFKSQPLFHVTLIAPDVSPRKYWWPLLNAMSLGSLKIGSKSESNVILFPPRSKQVWHFRPLPWDLHAFRIIFLGFCFLFVF